MVVLRTSLYSNCLSKLPGSGIGSRSIPIHLAVCSTMRVRLVDERYGNTTSTPRNNGNYSCLSSEEVGKATVVSQTHVDSRPGKSWARTTSCVIRTST